MAMVDRVSSSASSPGSSPAPSVKGDGDAIAEDTLFVAVCREVADSKSVLLWALKNRGDSPICVIHVHQPEIPVPNELGMLPMAHRVTERERLLKKLDKHIQFCSQHGVKAVKMYIEMESIQEGIVKLITDMKIGKLVMGAASDRRLSKDMIDVMSEKALYVRQRAPGYCNIRFICKKFLIHTREATEKFGSLNPSASYDLGGLLDEQRSSVGNRSSSDSSEHSSVSGPSAPDRRLVRTGLMLEQLERRLESAMEQAETYKKERDHMKVERDNAIKQVEETRHQLMDSGSCFGFPTLCYELPFQEIEKATNKFDPYLKIGEDAYGNIYKGFLDLKVTVKVPRPSSSSSLQEFQQEVEILGYLRHPNIMNLISICPESQALIYEYCANGSLEDQLNSNVGGSTLLWKTRFRICVELCIVLMFLHSHKPLPIIHGDIRAENIHLDAQYTCKLSGFRASSAIASRAFSMTDSGAISYAYTDPEYFATGELTTGSDVFSYGIILLRLLTGKPAMKLIRQVQIAVDTDKLGALLDPSAGWPLQQAKQLAALALSCTQMTSGKRPDFVQDVWKVLESILEGII